MKKLFFVLAFAGIVGSVSASTTAVLNHNKIVSVLNKDKKKDKKDKKDKKCCHGGGCCNKDKGAGTDTNTPK